MIGVGIFTGYFPYSIAETIRRIKALDFNCVQLDVSFKDCDATRGELDAQKARLIRDSFRDANLPIIGVSAYTNFVHPDPARRAANIRYFKMMCDYAHDLGSPYVCSETGTYDPDSDWVWHDKNGTEEAYQETLEIIGDLVRHAQSRGVTFLVENYVNNVIGSVDRILRLFHDIDSPNIALLCDPTNYFDMGNIGKVDETLKDVFDRLAHSMVIAHAKDCKVAESTAELHADIDADESHTFRGAGGVELPAAGLGVLNYPLYMELLGAAHPNIPLIIEHLDEGDIPRAKAFVDGVLKAKGV
ncbi:MAG: sugar phosphate isomerase/epimerase [Lachnospiraceae bacterium]|jgi:sugar phosphate isomerase/epimerase|nr:sugar phosphate isomerase/epimerase [Lachnospiraceae bacterium]